MAAKKKPAKKQSSWVEVPLEVSAVPWSPQACNLEPLDGSLFVAKLWEGGFAVLDGSKPGAPRVVTQYASKSNAFSFHSLREWPALALVSDGAIELLNIEDPAKPRLLAFHEFDVGWQRAVTVMGTDLYVTHQNGVAWLDAKTGQPEHLFDVPDDAHFGSYPTALTHHGEWLFVAGRHAGVHAYQRTGQKTFTHRRGVRRGYTPTRFQWWEPGKTLLMVGNEDVIAVDVTKPEAMKVSPSCKVKGSELETPLHVMAGTTAFVGGPKLRAKTLIFATLDLSTPLAPKLLDSEIVAAADGADLRSSSCVRVGDQVFVASVYLDRLRVFAQR